MNILGETKITYNQLKAWVKSKKSADPLLLTNLPSIWRAAIKRGILPEVMCSQVCIETGYFKFGGVLDTSYHNTCGLKTTKGGSDKASYGTSNLKGCRESALCEYNNIIYVLGGYNGNTFANISAVPYVFAYNTITETWENAWASSLANIPDNLYPKNSIAISYMGHIHLIGGRNENGSSTMNNNCVYLI